LKGEEKGIEEWEGRLEREEESLDFEQASARIAFGEAREFAVAGEVIAVAHEHDAIVPGFDGGDVSKGGEDFEFGDLEEENDGRRGRAEAIADFLLEQLERGGVGGLSEFAVELDTLLGVVDVVEREEGGRGGGAMRGGGFGIAGGEGKKIEACDDVWARGDFFAFEGGDALFKELAIEFEADGGDVAALFGAEEVAGAADFEVAHGDFEAAAEGGVLFDGADAFAGVGKEGGVAREEEIGVGLVFVAADAAAELVEVAEAEAIGAIDDDGIGVGDIDAAFDDGGGEENIGVAIDEAGHDFFEVIVVHLAVADDEPSVRDEREEPLGDGMDGGDAVVQEEDLASAIEFALDGVADDAFVVGGDDGFDGEPVLGWSFDGAHVARAGESEVERAGDGSGAEREDVDKAAHLFERFLVSDAEALFFVDDDEAQVFEGDVLLDEAMGADDDIDGARGEVAEDELLLVPGAEAGEEFDADGVIGHAFAEGVEVLLGEDGGGDKDSDLTAIDDGFEGCADGDFGFTEADVAADEAVHGARGFEV
jgi:hypothetical protein